MQYRCYGFDKPTVMNQKDLDQIFQIVPAVIINQHKSFDKL